MADEKRRRDLVVEWPVDGPPRVRVNGVDVAVGEESEVDRVRLSGPGTSIVVQRPGGPADAAAVADDRSLADLADLLAAHLAAPMAGQASILGADGEQTASIVQNQFVTVNATGPVTITMKENATVEQEINHKKSKAEKR